MLLKPGSVVRLDALGTAVLSFVDLQYQEAPSPEALAQAIDSFGRHVYDNADREEEIRRALAYALNLPDDELAATVRALRVPYPRFDPAAVRRLFEAIWAKYFASWEYEPSLPPPPRDYLQVEWGGS